MMIGRHRVVDRLATGGMADVFLAVDPDAPGEPLVIKRILPHLAEDGTFVRMFLQEARIAMAVRHPNVVRIHKLGEHEGLPFLQMDFVPGLTFRELVREAGDRQLDLPDGVAVDLVAQAAEGAHAVHETVVGEHREIVHRDLCPHNLMVDEEGVVKVLDFGIAKAAQGMDHTHTGVLKGKTSYLAPEQIRRARVDRRTDLWTLSVVAWELLAHRRMFPDQADYDIMQAIAAGDVPRLDQVRPDLPGLIVEVVHRSLTVDREARFATAEDLAHALRDAGEAAGIPTHPAATRSFVRASLGLDALDTATDHSDVLVSRSADVPDLDLDAPEPPPPAEPEGRGPWGWALAAFAVLAVVLFVGGIAVGALVLAPTPLEGPVIHLTFAPVMPPADMVEELEPLRVDLERSLGQPVAIQVAPTYEATSRLLDDGRTELAVLPPFLYLQTRERLGEGLELIAFTEHDNADGVDGIIIGRKDAPWQGPESLRGASFCYTDQSSTTGHALPRRYMRSAGIDPEADLGETHFSGNHHQVIADVAAGRCTYGATFSGSLLSAYDVDVPVQQTRQLDITGRTPNDAVCAGPRTAPALVERVREALLAWDPSETHGARYVGDRLHLTGFTPAGDAAYDPLRDALDPE